MSKQRLPNISEITECPKCGNGNNFYYSAPAKGRVVTVLRFSDKQYDPTSNEMMYQGVFEGKANKYIHCSNCLEIIAKNDII